MLRIRVHEKIAAALAVATFASAAQAQITTTTGDGILNAPYRGTIDSLRECSQDVAYGEVMTHVEPRISTETISSSIQISSDQPWDRSVLRMYQGLDASGNEIDLTTPQSVSRDIDNVKRFSFKAIGTNTLAVQSFTIRFSYVLGGSGVNPSVTIKVAPMTGSFCNGIDESQAFLYGTKVLDVSVGNARLVVPIGVTGDEIGAAYIAKEDNLGPTGIDQNNVVFPGAAESVHIQNFDQFELNTARAAKTEWGTPWPGYLIGYRISTDPFGPDGTHFDATESASQSFRSIDYIRPLGLSEANKATQHYLYDGSNRVTQINDQATPNNVITLNRSTPGLVQITTSDGRGWDIEFDTTNRYITAVIPDSGKGARRFTWSAPLADIPEERGRVTEVKDGNQNTRYKFTYTAAQNGDLLTEERYIEDDDPPQLRVAVQHSVVDQTHRRQKRFFGSGASDYRQTDFAYDAAFKHRLASMTVYSEPAVGGTPHTTTFTHDVNNPSGTVALTRVDLPDGTWIEHEYAPTTEDFPFRTKSIHHGDGVQLVTYDVDYEFFFPGSHLFFKPRIVKQRDGRGVISEVTYDYENGGVDETGDTVNGEFLNQLLSRTGPTINDGPSDQRSPQTRFDYYISNDAPLNIFRGLLMREETDSDLSTYRSVEYAYDDLLRLTTRAADPPVDPDPDLNLVTTQLYCDGQSHQARTTVDPDGYRTRTTYDNDGRVITETRFLDANVGNPADACTAPSDPDYYRITYAYDIQGYPDTKTVENKDQVGASLTPPTIVTDYTHDRLGRLTLTAIDTQQANIDYNWLGEIEQEFDTSGRGRALAYDGRGLVKSETALKEGPIPDTALVTTFKYDDMGRLQFTYPPTHTENESVDAGPVTERVYDDFGRLENLIRHPGSGGGATITTTYEYDEANHVTRTLVEEDTGGTLTALSDTTSLFDEGGFNYKSRRRTASDADTPDVDPITEREFDWAGNVLVERSLGDADATVADREIITEYDDANRVKSVTDSEEGETKFTLLDGRGNVKTQEVKLQSTPTVVYAITDTEYDALSRPTKVTDPGDAVNGGVRHFRTRGYDSRGNLLRETHVDATVGGTGTPKMTTVFQYDNAGRQKRSAVLADPAAATDAASALTQTDRVVDLEYYTDGRLRYRKTYNKDLPAPPLTTETTYDEVGRVYVVSDPSGSTTTHNYLANGRLDTRVVNDGLGDRTFRFGYDGHDRVIAQTDEGAQADGDELMTEFALDGLDRQVVVTDPREIKTKTVFDLPGRRTQLIKDFGGPLESPTVFAYNRLDQLVTQTVHNNAFYGPPLPPEITTFRSDTLGRQARIVYPDALSPQHADPDNCTDCVRMGYDVAGRMTQRTDQRQQLTTFAYDDRGLLFKRTSGTAVDRFAHDALGRLKTAQRGTEAQPAAVSRSDMDYTGLGDLDHEMQAIAGVPARTTDYTYDQAGNRKALKYTGAGPPVTPEPTLTYTPTDLNQVEEIRLGLNTLVSYAYQDRVLDSRTTATTSANSSYTTAWGHDGHRRVNGITHSAQTPLRGLETIADYVLTHDNGGNPTGQVALSGTADFEADDRGFTVDTLNRLTDTTYFGSGETESSLLDRVGNREQHIDRMGEAADYALANTCNEYATINDQAVDYDEAGNLTTDQAGRHYSYDEQSRLTEVRAPNNSTVLAQYTYDAFGRRITFFDGTATTRYYYDGSNVIEERNTSDQRLRYHVNGAQYVDERVATFTHSTPGSVGGQFEYYLPGQNFSVAGVGDPDGSVTRFEYSAMGDLTGPPDGFFFDADGDGDIQAAQLDGSDWAGFEACYSGPTPFQPGCAPYDFDRDGDVDLEDWQWFQHFATLNPDPAPLAAMRSGSFAHDADGDRDVDLEDYAIFVECWNTPAAQDYAAVCLGMHDFNNQQASDGDVDFDDFGGFQVCDDDGANHPPDDYCFRPGPDGVTPGSGDFAMHGRPVDVLDGGNLVLGDFRARRYDAKNGRWLQRDPKGYVDGGNLYEAFGSNPLANTDPMGTDWFAELLIGPAGKNLSTWDVIFSNETVADVTFGVVDLGTDPLNQARRRAAIGPGAVSPTITAGEIALLGPAGGIRSFVLRNVVIGAEFGAGEFLRDYLVENRVQSVGEFTTNTAIFTGGGAALEGLFFVGGRVIALFRHEGRLVAADITEQAFAQGGLEGAAVAQAELAPMVQPSAGASGKQLLFPFAEEGLRSSLGQLGPPTVLVIDEYGVLARNQLIPGQAHHLNQAAAYGEVIPYRQGMAIKLQGNIFSDAGAPHTRVHVYLEDEFWQLYRIADVAAPTNLQFTRAMQQSLRVVGLTEAQVQQAVRVAIEERVRFGLLGGMEVPNVPNPIPNLAR